MLTPRARQVGPSRRGDAGSAIVNVLVLMIVTSVVAVGIGTSVVVSGGVTFTTTERVRADAAAEAGIDYARAQIAAQIASGSSGCGGWNERSGDPSFVVAEPVYRNAEGGVLTCTALADVATATIVSTGYSSTASEVSAQVGAQFDVTAPTTTEDVASGGAVYVGGGGGLSAFTVTVSEPTLVGDIQVPQGNLDCNSSSNIQGSIVVASGSVTINSNCVIQGDVIARDGVDVSSGAQIGGDVISATSYVRLSNSNIVVGGDVSAATYVYVQNEVYGSVSAAGTAGSHNSTIVNSARIHGNLDVGSNVTSFQGRVDGNVSIRGNANFSASSARVGGTLKIGGTLSTMGGGVYGGSVSAAGTGTTEFPPSTRVTGDLRIGGTFNSWGYPSPNWSQDAAWNIQNAGWVSGTAAQNQTGLTVPAAPTAHAAPTIPSWVDWSYDQAAWAAAGWTVVTAASGPGCWVASPTVWSAALPHTAKLLVDARACSGRVGWWGSGTFSAWGDVAIVANDIYLAATTWVSADGAAHKVYLLQPDNTANGAATCTSGAVEGNGTHNFATAMAVMVYTPCQFTFGSTTVWRGQIYASRINAASGNALVYVPLGVPGTDLSGESESGGSEETAGEAGVAVVSRYPIE